MITYRELRNSPAKVERLVKAGKPFAVTKRGRPYFDIVPRRAATAAKTLDEKIAAACGDFSISNKALVASRREAWGR